MLVWRADRFGLAQLHQLRGRVGRGREQGVCYLLTDPGEELPEATRARLGTLEAFDRLGAGLAISARDLDLRGAGDIAGDEQAGHLKLIGAGLYQRLLERAVLQERGEPVEEDWTPQLNIGAEAGDLPDDYVPEAEVRLTLYARLARLASADEAHAFRDEVEDRFGPLPREVEALLDAAALRLRCRALGIAKADAGPKGLALTFRTLARAEAAAAVLPQARRKDERLVVHAALEDESERRAALERVLEALEAIMVPHLLPLPLPSPSDLIRGSGVERPTRI